MLMWKKWNLFFSSSSSSLLYLYSDVNEKAIKERQEPNGTERECAFQSSLEYPPSSILIDKKTRNTKKKKKKRKPEEIKLKSIH